MAVSVRMEPLLEKELELAAKRQGVTKSQFIIEAVQRALGRKSPYELLMKIKAEEEASPGHHRLVGAFEGEGYQGPYDADTARDYIKKKIKAKHGLSSD